MAGPTPITGHKFGSDVTTARLRIGKCAEDRQLRLGRILPVHLHSRRSADAHGTFSIGVESRRTEVLLKGTTKNKA